MHGQLLVDPLLGLVSTTENEYSGGQDEIVELGETAEQLTRGGFDILHQCHVALDEFVDGPLGSILHCWFGERADDGLCCSAIPAAEDDVCIPLGVAGKGLGHGLSYARRPAHEEGMWDICGCITGICSTNDGERRHRDECRRVAPAVFIARHDA